MDVYISEEYVAQRRAERRAARIAAAAARGGDEKARARADGEQKRWTTTGAAWAEKGKRPADGGGNADTNVGGGGAAWLVGEDAVFSYFSA